MLFCSWPSPSSWYSIGWLNDNWVQVPYIHVWPVLNIDSNEWSISTHQRMNISMTHVLTGSFNWFLSVRRLRQYLCQRWFIVSWIHINKIQPTWWRHQMETFSALLAFCTGNSPVPGEFTGSPGQWRGALMFSLICFWINRWVNSREAGDLRRYRAHYDVTVMNINQNAKLIWI